MEKYDLRKFCWRAGVVLVAEIILALVIFWVLMPIGEYLEKPAYLEVLVKPVSTRVEINGAEYRNGVYELEPGVYTATVALEGEPMEVAEFELKQNETTGLYMNWTEAKGWQYETEEGLKHRNAISEVMPIHAAVCGVPATRTNCDAATVTYENACGGEWCLVIRGRGEKLTKEMSERVREELEARGYDWDDYQYVYLQEVDR